MPSKCSSEMFTSQNLPGAVCRRGALPAPQRNGSVPFSQPSPGARAPHSLSRTPESVSAHVPFPCASPTSLPVSGSTTISTQTCCCVFGPRATPQLPRPFPVPFTALLTGAVYPPAPTFPLLLSPSPPQSDFYTSTPCSKPSSWLSKYLGSYCAPSITLGSETAANTTQRTKPSCSRFTPSGRQRNNILYFPFSSVRDKDSGEKLGRGGRTRHWKGEL